MTTASPALPDTGQTTAARTRPTVKEQLQMNHPYVQAALARERQNMLLAEAAAARRASQARSARRRRGTLTVGRSLLRWPPDWLPSAWSRPLTQPPESASTATGAPATLHDRSAMAGGQARPGARPDAAAYQALEPSL